MDMLDRIQNNHLKQYRIFSKVTIIMKTFMIYNNIINIYIYILIIKATFQFAFLFLILIYRHHLLIQYAYLLFEIIDSIHR